MFSYLRQPRGFYRRLFLLALPIIVQNLITTSLGFLDTFMVGLLGSEQMSAVTVANVPIFIIQLIVFGLQSGSSVLISQYWGRGDRESINRVIGIGLCIAGSVSTLFALIMAFFPADVLLLVTDNLRLVAIGTPYIRIVGFSYILNSLSSIYIGMQRSIENPRFGMLVFGASMLCNTVGNYVLIFGKLGFPALGVTGAAAATLLSRVVEFALAFGYALRCRTVPLQWSALLRPGREMLRRFVHYSAPVLANETLWGVGYSLITVIMGHMAASGDLIAAYTVAGSIDKLSTAGIFIPTDFKRTWSPTQPPSSSARRSASAAATRASCASARPCASRHFSSRSPSAAWSFWPFLRCSGRMCCRFSPSRRARRRCARSWCTATRV